MHRILILLWLPFMLCAEIDQTPRTMIGLWDSKEQFKIVKSSIPIGLEMPLNHLGIRVEYHDVQKPLPDVSHRKDVLGIIIWFPDDYPYKQADNLIGWVNNLIEQGKKLIFVISPYSLSELSAYAHMAEILEKLGILANDNWVPYTYNYELGKTESGYYPFEASLDLTLPSFIKLKIDKNEIDPLISLKRKDGKGEELPMVFTHANGLFAFDSFFVKATSINDEIKTKWLVNPFKTLRKALNWHGIPVPDATTLCGRRIYYSQIDGDGWSNATLTKRENNVDPTLSAEIVLEKFVGPAKDMPVTVAPIAGDLNPAWFGSPKTQELARKYFALPQVEIGCHTYSHPFDWGFFRNYTPQKERPYLHSYPTKTFDDGTFAFFKTLIPKPSSYYSVLTDEEKRKTTSAHSELEKGYTIPRAFAVQPFDLTLEITGAIHEVNAFAPPDKNVDVYQWSGNGQAFPEAVKMTQDDHVQNINGGNSQLDFAHPSYGDVTALGINLDGYYQVYNSNSNENNYTELWTENFYGFVTLSRTFQWTESPLRIKPIDLYYHMYSGERQSSLAALHRNMDFIRSQNIIPIHTSHYCRIVDGFYATEIAHQDNDRWTLGNRGDLQTLRMDDAVCKGIDFQRSKGVLGQRHYQGSLYIALDPSIKEPEVSFKELEDVSVEPIEAEPYLLDSRWQISRMSREGNLSFDAIGFGPLEVSLVVPKERIYHIEAKSMEGDVLASEWTPSVDHHLNVSLDLPYQTLIRIAISEEGQPP